MRPEWPTPAARSNSCGNTAPSQRAVQSRSPLVDRTSDISSVYPEYVVPPEGVATLWAEASRLVTATDGCGFGGLGLRTPTIAIVHARWLSVAFESEAADRFSFQVLVGVEVLAGGFKVAVAHEFLNRDDVGARFKEAGGVGVAEFVEGGVLDAGAVGDLLEAAQQSGGSCGR